LLNLECLTMKERSPGTSELMKRAALPANLLAFLLLAPSPQGVLSQSVSQRTPNLSNGWTPASGVVQFNFTHRFDISDAPLRKITNTPSFQVATGVTGPLGVGFVFGSNSDLVPAYPNEWEWFARWSAVRQDAGAMVDASVQAGWNVASESFDAEINAARDVGPLRLLVAGRAFQHAFYVNEARYALAGGAALRLLPWLTIAGDYATLLDRADHERPVWGAGLQLTVPTTPHSISIHAGNVGTGSMEGASRGSHTRWGFEYTVPITLRRYASNRTPRRRPAATSEPAAATASAAPAARDADTVVVTIRNFRFTREKLTVNAGDVVVWRNEDPVAHTILSDSGGFTSPLVEPRQDWSHRFSTPGTFTYYCHPHPFMRAEIRVNGVKP
jgi:plastocyanin